MRMSLTLGLIRKSSPFTLRYAMPIQNKDLSRALISTSNLFLPMQTSLTRVIGDDDDSKSETVRTVKDRNGWRPPTGYSRSVMKGTTRDPLANVRIDFTWNGGERYYIHQAGLTMCGGAYQPSDPVFPAKLVSKAEVQALNKLKAQNVNLGLAFAERAKTATMIGQRVNQLVDFVKAARKLDVQGALSALGVDERHRRRHTYIRDGRDKTWLPFSDDRVSRLVLEHAYGWQPLISDCYGIMKELLDKDSLSERYIVTVKGYANERFDSEQRLTGTGHGNSGLVQCTVRRTVRGVHTCNVRLDYVLANAEQATAARLGLTNPVAVAYDLIPFSHVVDWFLPIGAYLSALDAAKGFTLKGGSCSQTTRFNWWGYIESAKVQSVYATQQVVSNNSPVSKAVRVIFNRSVYGSSPIPALPGLTGTGIGLDGSPVSRCMKAIAMLHMFVKGKDIGPDSNIR